MTLKKTPIAYEAIEIEGIINEQFALLPEIGFLVCRACGYCVAPNHVGSHTIGDKDNHRAITDQRSARDLQKAVNKRWPDIPRRRDPVHGDNWISKIPRSRSTPFSELTLHRDGLQCLGCGYICLTKESIRSHLKDVHGEGEGGGEGEGVQGPVGPLIPSRHLSATTRAVLGEVMPKRYREGVACQRIFRSGPGSRFFAITDASETSTGATADGSNPNGMIAEQDGERDGVAAELARRFTVIYTSASQDKLAKRKEKYDKIALHAADQPNPFIDRLRAVDVFGGLNVRGEVLPLICEPLPHLDQDRFETLQAVSKALIRLVRKCCSVLPAAGIAVLTELNRAPSVTGGRPFANVKSETIRAYGNFVRYALLYVLRTYIAGEARPVRYVTTAPVVAAIERVLKLGRAAGTVPARVGRYILPASTELGKPVQHDLPTPAASTAAPPEAEKMTEEETAKSSWKPIDPTLLEQGLIAELDVLEVACLELLIALLEQPLKASEWESPLIVGLSALAILPNGRWMEAPDYTKRLAGLIFVSRVVRLQHAARSAVSKSVSGAEFGGVITELMSQRPRILGEDFDIRGRWSILAWAFQLKNFGASITRTLTNAGEVYVDGRQILFRGHRLSLDQLTGMIQGLLRKALVQLTQTLCFGLVTEDELAVISLEGIVDDAARDRVGKCFTEPLAEAAGIADGGEFHLLGLLCGGDRAGRRKTDVLAKLLSRAGTGPEGLKPASPPSSPRPTAGTITRDFAYGYVRQVQVFLGQLLVLMHLTGGQPSRGPEILSIRHTSTGNGGPRNLVTFRGKVISRVDYSKTYSPGKPIKPIIRVYPDPIGRLLSFYLLVVQPFFETVVTAVRSGRAPEEYLWNHEPVLGDPGWTSERLSLLLATEFEVATGCQGLGIQDYRHVAIAIARHFLAPEVGDLLLTDTRDHGTDENVSSDEDWHGGDPELATDGTDGRKGGISRVVTIADVRQIILDAQAGHSSRIATNLYARNADGSPTTAAYHAASADWHACLGFVDGAAQPGGPYEGRSRSDARERERESRRDKLRQIGLQGLLQDMYPWKTEVNFRGRQEELLNRIRAGTPALLAVVGVGGGKSLLFMLPAKSGFGGMSVVLAPTVSLVRDLARRCGQHGISHAAWNPEHGWPTDVSLVFTTPAAFKTDAFQSFVNNATKNRTLDRIFIDECHTALEGWRVGDEGFGRLIGAGTQVICLTGTLPPDRESRLWSKLGIPVGETTVVRESTARRNIAYSVTDAPEGAGMDNLIALVEGRVADFRRRRTHSRSPAVIVYCRRKDVADGVAGVLGCPCYYQGYPNKEGVLEDFLSCRLPVIVATCALGLGIDHDAVGLVVHLGRPNGLEEYVQESGRAGRSGVPAEAQLITHGLVDIGRADPSMAYYLRPSDAVAHGEARSPCRRAILDLLDGESIRTGCGPDEQACDLCANLRGHSEPSGDTIISDTTTFTTPRRVNPPSEERRGEKRALQDPDPELPTARRVTPPHYTTQAGRSIPSYNSKQQSEAGRSIPSYSLKQQSEAGGSIPSYSLKQQSEAGGSIGSYSSKQQSSSSGPSSRLGRYSSSSSLLSGSPKRQSTVFSLHDSSKRRSASFGRSNGSNQQQPSFVSASTLMNSPCPPSRAPHLSTIQSQSQTRSDIGSTSFSSTGSTVEHYTPCPRPPSLQLGSDDTSDPRSAGRAAEHGRLVQAERVSAARRRRDQFEGVQDAITYLRRLGQDLCVLCPQVPHHPINECNTPQRFRHTASGAYLLERLDFVPYCACYYCWDPQFLCPRYHCIGGDIFKADPGKCPRRPLREPLSYILRFPAVEAAFDAALRDLDGTDPRSHFTNLQRELGQVAYKSGSGKVALLHLLLPSLVTAYRREVVSDISIQSSSDESGGRSSPGGVVP